MSKELADILRSHARYVDERLGDVGLLILLHLGHWYYLPLAALAILLVCIPLAMYLVICRVVAWLLYLPSRLRELKQ